MKIFDFTEGRKGAELGFTRVANATGGWLVRKADSVYKIELAAQPEGWEWATGASWLRGSKDEGILPESYGVGAICFCIGEMNVGNGKNVWRWFVVGTNDWNKNACKRGILKATFVRQITEDSALVEDDA